MTREITSSSFTVFRNTIMDCAIIDTGNSPKSVGQVEIAIQN